MISYRLDMKVSVCVMLINFLIALSADADDQDIPLTDEFSRAYLSNYAASFDDQWKALPYKFIFPQHTNTTEIYGIDVSHHQGPISWSMLPEHNIVFVVAKASQGERFFDPRFGEHWDELASLQKSHPNLYKGAYHFLTADGDASLQAKNFLQRVGEQQKNDLPPTLDVEWDFRRIKGKLERDQNGRPIDQWTKYTPDQIAAKISKWLSIVETATGKRPLIYTSRYWWDERMPGRKEFTQYKFWIADYASKSLNKENPRVPTGHNWVLWQFTDAGSLSKGGIKGRVDVNTFNGLPSEFTTKLGLVD